MENRPDYSKEEFLECLDYNPIRYDMQYYYDLHELSHAK